MKILLAVHHYLPRYTGGVELVTQRAAHWMASHGHQVEIVCIEAIDHGNGPEVSVQTDQHAGIAVHRLSLNLAAQGDQFQTSYRNPLIGAWVANQLRAVRPDIIHVQSCYLISASVIEAAHQADVPVIVSLHDYWFICPRINLLHPDGSRCAGPSPADCAWCLKTERRRYRLPDQLTGGALGSVVRHLARQPQVAAHLGWKGLFAAINTRRSYLTEQLRSVDLIVTPSRFVRELMIRQGLDAGCIRWVAHGLDLSGCRSGVRRPRLKGQFRIGYLGNLLPLKGVHLVIEAFKRLEARDESLQLRLHGDPDKFPDYTRRLRKLAGDDPRIVFAGRYDNHEVEGLLEQIDVLVVPSTCYEIGPLVTLEAFASKTPVVAADLPSMNDQVAPEVDGLLFRADDHLALGRQLQRLVDDPLLLGRLREGIRPVRSSDDEMKEWLSLYEQVLAR
jgi:glycosyltransferase involved in cell wall biosynthesis